MLIGLAGSAGTGKDTIADYLVEQYGFTKFSFSDALYREVSEAFGVSVEELQDRDKKELPHPGLIAHKCKDTAFFAVMFVEAERRGALSPGFAQFSPRWVLQRWGTEYRRAQDPDYWLKQAALWVKAWLDVTKDDGEHHPGLVNTSVRFPNEQAWIDEMGGVVWHVRRPERDGCASELDYVSEQELPVGANDRVIWNTGTVEQLNTAVSLLLQSPADEDPDASLCDSAYDYPHPAKHKLVVCPFCYTLHKAYTKEQVDAEVALVNGSLESGLEAVVSADDYRGCVACGYTGDMIPIDSVDTARLQPALYEEKP
jgi:hypothetical protein